MTHKEPLCTYWPVGRALFERGLPFVRKANIFLWPAHTQWSNHVRPVHPMEQWRVFIEKVSVKTFHENHPLHRNDRCMIHQHHYTPKRQKQRHWKVHWNFQFESAHRHHILGSEEENLRENSRRVDQHFRAFGLSSGKLVGFRKFRNQQIRCLFIKFPNFIYNDYKRIFSIQGLIY